MTNNEKLVKALKEIANLAVNKAYTNTFKLDRIYSLAWAAINENIKLEKGE